MPNTRGRLSRQELIFAQQFARTGDGPYAAARAGYASPAKRASQNLAKPLVAEAARREARRLLNEDGPLIGVQVLMDIAADEKQPAGARRAAASDLVKHSGISSATTEDEKELHEMSAAELQRRIAQLRERTDAFERERVDRARPQLQLAADPDGIFG